MYKNTRINKIAFPRGLFAAIHMLCMLGCQGPSDTSEKLVMDVPTKTQVTQFANNYILENFPNWPAPEAGWVPEVLDQGDNWEFRYALPPNVTGGGPVVVINKKTMAVIKAYHEQ